MPVHLGPLTGQVGSGPLPDLPSQAWPDPTNLAEALTPGCKKNMHGVKHMAVPSRGDQGTDLTCGDVAVECNAAVLKSQRFGTAAELTMAQ